MGCQAVWVVWTSNRQKGSVGGRPPYSAFQHTRCQRHQRGAGMGCHTPRGDVVLVTTLCARSAYPLTSKGERAVSQFMRYTCKAGLLPVVKAALIANGYTLDGSSQTQRCAAAAPVVLQCGAISVLLAQPPNNAVAEIEVWGAGQSAVSEVFEALPIALHRLPPRCSATR